MAGEARVAWQERPRAYVYVYMYVLHERSRVNSRVRHDALVETYELHDGTRATLVHELHW